MNTFRIQILFIFLLSCFCFQSKANPISSDTLIKDTVTSWSVDSIEQFNTFEWSNDFNEQYSGRDFDYIEKDKKKVSESSDWSPNFSPLIFGSLLTIFYLFFKIFLVAAALFILYKVILYLKDYKPNNKKQEKVIRVNLNPDEIEDIHEIDFEKEINEAQEIQDFRLAIRWSYLWSLKIMDDKKMIDWRPKKTNQDYTRELKSKAHKKTFKKLTYIFDYTWFGQFSITETIFQDTMSEFATYRKNIQ